jgi:glycosyltransferase involved in cell wall biosynthesis
MIATIYNCASAGARASRSAPVAKPGFTLINVARHSPEKDLTTLLDAVAIARQARPDLHLWLLGEGVLTRNLMEHAASLDLGRHVTFFGERTDVGDWLSRADLFVMSSVSEGLPVSLLEAMEAGLPQVVTSVGGMAEVVGMSGGGTLVPPRDPRALAASMVALADNPRRLAELGARSRACYRQHFSPERMNAEYLDLYRECGAPDTVSAVTATLR